MAGSWTRVWLGLAVVCCLLTAGDCGGHLAVRLISYFNRDGRDSTGELCDKNYFGKTSDCDFAFEIKLDGNGSGYWETETKTYDNMNSVTFSDYLSKSEVNPLNRSFSRWHGRLTLKVQVFDMDALTPADADTLEQSLAVDPDGVSRRYRTVGRDHNGNSYLNYSVTVSCDPNFYTSTCEKYCRPEDSAAHGHFTCTSAGDKRCRPGWLDVANSCQDRDECAISGICQNNGTCNRNNDSYICTCAPGFTGRHCERSARWWILIGAVTVAAIFLFVVILAVALVLRRHRLLPWRSQSTRSLTIPAGLGGVEFQNPVYDDLPGRLAWSS